MEASLVRANSQLSKHVHGRSETVVDEEAKQDAEATEIVSAIGAFLAGYRDARKQLLDPLAESLDSGAVDALLSETILSVDELSSHHSVRCDRDAGNEIVELSAQSLPDQLVQGRQV